MPSKYKSRLLDEGWPGRAKLAESSDGFMDFKSKIEARLSAVNDPSLVSQLQTDSNFRQSTDSSRWLKTLSSIKRNSILSKSK
ncbi:uncharacterized protein B0P05DRAFT_553498 [Gilbertella persicaria]|uniref:uncharacterized protein n=1 Tax=Gilbertella persicaria TaxID=101096 RepID=UPI00221E424D|nr:uncharacterized protein B0P05DRAFT_553498 [Gilbertella persicaria]KAI8066236.1 hypothetical protein B0P05DRAFT_553498 [Gilbertella persicaria]